jgi:hypothetical protein
MPLENTFPSADIVNALTQGRGLGLSDPSQQQLTAQRWYDNPLVRAIPGLSSVGELISGSHGQIAPTEGVNAIPLGSFSDPISQSALLIAPMVKAFLARQSYGMGQPSFLTGVRGSTGSNEGENSIDAFKRMFLQRGGVESGQGKALPSYTQNAEEMLAGMKAEQLAQSEASIPRPMTTSELSKAYPEYTRFIDSASERFSEQEITTALSKDKNLHDLLNTTYKLTTTPTKNPDQIVGFLQRHANKTIDSIESATERGYVETLFDKNNTQLGFVLTEDAQSRIINKYLNTEMGLHIN